MTNSEKDAVATTAAGSFFRYKIFAPLLIGLIVSLFIAASKGWFLLDRNSPATLESILDAVIRAIFDNVYLLLIPPILAQALSIQFLAGEMKETLSSREKNAATQIKELKDLYASTAQILRTSNDLTPTDHSTIGMIAERTSRLNNTVRDTSALQKLIEWRKRQLFEDLLAKLDHEGKGILSFDSEDEISLNIDIVSAFGLHPVSLTPA